MAETSNRGVRPAPLIALVVGCLLIVPAIAVGISGVVLAAGYQFGRDDAGFWSTTLDRVTTDSVAVSTPHVDFDAGAGGPQWVIDALDTDVRLRVSSAEADGAVFIGIADQTDVSAYLSGVAHDEVREINRRTVILRPRSGGETIDPPERETFWAVSASGVGTQEIVWPATAGRWAAVVMNADRSPGITADIDVGIRAGFVWPLAVGLIAAGLLGASVGAGLIAVGAIGLSATEASSSPARVIGAHDLGDTVDGSPRSPVRLEARLDPALSRWRWLIKWFLATPHYVILVFLWVGFAVVTLIAGIAILFTGRYPDWAFAYTSGVLRWSWRVNYYAMTGGLGPINIPRSVSDQIRGIPRRWRSTHRANSPGAGVSQVVAVGYPALSDYGIDHRGDAVGHLRWRDDGNWWGWPPRPIDSHRWWLPPPSKSLSQGVV